MKILRATMYSPDLEPYTVVLQETYLLVPIEEAIESSVMPGCFTVTDVFEVADSMNLLEATLESTRRLETRAERERNMAMLYYWDAAQFAHLNPGGVLTSTRPAPLSVKEVEITLKQLAQHPEYRNQTILCITEVGELVLMRDGKCEVKEL